MEEFKCNVQFEMHVICVCNDANMIEIPSKICHFFKNKIYIVDFRLLFYFKIASYPIFFTLSSIIESSRG